MAEKIFIEGFTGSGKSYSLRNLNPQKTFIIQVVKKMLPFKGSKNDYQLISKKNPQGNLARCKDYEGVIKILKYVNKERPKIEVIILDDVHYLITKDYMRRIPDKETKGDTYKKFGEMAYNFDFLLNMAEDLRNDLYIFFLAHTQVNSDGTRTFKTIGKMLDEKIVLEGLVSIVLEAKRRENKYVFQTNLSDSSEPCKSPYGMFEDLYIDNDLNFVLKKIKEFLD